MSTDIIHTQVSGTPVTTPPEGSLAFDPATGLMYLRSTGAWGAVGGGGLFDSEAVLIDDVAPVPGSGVAMRDSGTIIGVAGPPIASRQLAIYGASNGRTYVYGLNGTGCIDLLNSTTVAVRLGEVASATYGVGTVSNTRFHLRTNNTTRVSVDNAAPEVGVGVTEQANVALGLICGTGSDVAHAGGPIFMSTTTVGTDADTVEKDLQSKTVAANTMVATNQGLYIIAWGRFAATATTKHIRLYYGSTVIYDNGVTTYNNLNWMLEGWVYRTGAATQKALGKGLVVSESPGLQITSPTETLSGTVAVRVTGQNGTGNLNDILCDGMRVDYISRT
jgi:hypothetical protein